MHAFTLKCRSIYLHCSCCGNGIGIVLEEKGILSTKELCLKLFPMPKGNNV